MEDGEHGEKSSGGYFIQNKSNTVESHWVSGDLYVAYKESSAAVNSRFIRSDPLFKREKKVWCCIWMISFTYNETMTEESYSIHDKVKLKVLNVDNVEKYTTKLPVVHTMNIIPSDCFAQKN